MSRRHADGEDAAYLEWHVLDHLPEQYRLAGLRVRASGGCRPRRAGPVRAASEPPFDAVDHVVQYLFAEPVGPALDTFFALGGALHQAGRMPIALPRVQVGGWRLDGMLAADRVLVGAAVAAVATGSWRLPAGRAGHRRRPPDARRALVAVAGVAGAWRWIGASPHERLEGTDGLTLTVCYLDDDPVEVATRLAPVLADRWATGGVIPLLAAPFEAVVAGAWDRHLP